MADNFAQAGTQVFHADLNALNNSGVAGDVTLLLDQRNMALTVDVEAKGLEPGQVHIMHIHGFTDGTDSRSPTIAQDADHDGFVELGEGATIYGPILLNLSLNPDDSAHDHGTAGHDHSADAMFPTVGADGMLHYRETFQFNAADANAQAVFGSLQPLDLKEVVIHGETVAAGSGAGTGGEVDGSGGYKAVLPVTSGEITGVTGSDALVAASGALGGGGVDWNAVAAVAEANFAASGHWFI